MTHRTKRCKHCKLTYSYQTSGHGCHDKINDVIYCPSCMERILKVLEDVPEQAKPKWLPFDHSQHGELLSLKQVERRIEQRNKKSMFGDSLRYITGYDNISWDFLTYKGAQYRVSTNTDTGDKILEIEIEDCANPKYYKGAFWSTDNYGFLGEGELEVSEARHKAFFDNGKSSARRLHVDWSAFKDIVQKMEPPEDDRIFYLQPVYNSQEDKNETSQLRKSNSE